MEVAGKFCTAAISNHYLQMIVLRTKRIQNISHHKKTIKFIIGEQMRIFPRHE